MHERNAISKEEYNKKRSNLKNKISKNKKLLSDDQKCLDELRFYSNYIGSDTFKNHSLKNKVESAKIIGNRILKLKILIPVFSLIIIIIGGIVYYKPIRFFIEEKIAWKNAVKENTYQSYKEYVIKYDNSRLQMTRPSEWKN